MDLTPSLEDFLAYVRDKCLPHLSVDVVIFGFHEDRLRVLLQRFFESDHFALIGGYIEHDEHLHDAAVRVLRERTGLEQLYLEQFHTFGSTDRLHTGQFRNIGNHSGGNPIDDPVITRRTISIAYYSLVDYTRVKPTGGPFSLESRWFDLHALPPLLFDHAEIIEKAMTALQNDLDRKLNGFKLMGETFTMAELQKLYEAVLQKKLVRANFQRKMLSLGMLKRLEKQYTGKAHKAPFLYRFRSDM